MSSVLSRFIALLLRAMAAETSVSRIHSNGTQGGCAATSRLDTYLETSIQQQFIPVKRPVLYRL
jgi:hypothetical protein